MIEIRDLKALVSNAQNLSGLSEKTLQILSQCAQEQRFAENAHLLRTGEPADRFFVLREGRVSIELEAGHKKMTTIQTLDAGSLLGWSWLMAPHRWHFSAQATTPVVAYCFDAKVVRERMEQDHDFGYEILNCIARLMAQRLESALPQIVGIT
ncbi:MAG: cyclic nucleotide-binding domain-containing protein [Elusimicrobia bacterium]|nr:cyclic nucleotide-binding domain-containing protein [Elusimicrobiota bacterium]